MAQGYAQVLKVHDLVFGLTSAVNFGRFDELEVSCEVAYQRVLMKMRDFCFLLLVIVHKFQNIFIIGQCVHN